MSRKPEIKEPFNASVDYGYTTGQWPIVRKRLNEIGIDIATTVAFVAPWRDHNKPVSRPLGDVLQEVAGYYGALARLEDHRLKADTDQAQGQLCGRVGRFDPRARATEAALRQAGGHAQRTS
jgi:hypothetical protein